MYIPQQLIPNFTHSPTPKHTSEWETNPGKNFASYLEDISRDTHDPFRTPGNPERHQESESTRTLDTENKVTNSEESQDLIKKTDEQVKMEKPSSPEVSKGMFRGGSDSEVSDRLEHQNPVPPKKVSNNPGGTVVGNEGRGVSQNLVASSDNGVSGNRLTGEKGAVLGEGPDELVNTGHEPVNKSRTKDGVTGDRAKSVNPQQGKDSPLERALGSETSEISRIQQDMDSLGVSNVSAEAVSGEFQGKNKHDVFLEQSAQPGQNQKILLNSQGLPTTVIQVVDLRTSAGRLQQMREGARGLGSTERPGVASVSTPAQLLNINLGDSANISLDTGDLVQIPVGLEEGDIFQQTLQGMRNLGPLQQNPSNPWFPQLSMIFGKLFLPENRLEQSGGSKTNEITPAEDSVPQAGSAQAALQRAVQSTSISGQDQASLIEYLRSAGAAEIVRSAKFILRDNNKGEIKLILKPERMGEVKISITLNDKSIDAHFLVDNKEVEEAFSETMEALKQAFSDQGFSTGDFTLETKVLGEEFVLDGGNEKIAGIQTQRVSQEYGVPNDKPWIYSVDLAV